MTDTKFQDQGKGTAGSVAIGVRFPREVADWLRSLPNTQDVIRKAVEEYRKKLQKPLDNHVHMELL